MKLTKSTAHALAGLLFALAPMSVQAQVPHSRLEFIEFSDMLLTATIDGSPVGTVNNVGPDHWEWRSGIFAWSIVPVVPAGRSTLWEEPSGETGVNSLSPNFFERDATGRLGNLG